MEDLFAPITNLKSVGAKRGEALKKLGIETPYDMLYHLPRGYVDFTQPVEISAVQPGERAVIRVKIVQKMPPAYIRKGMTIFRALATDGTSDIIVTIYNNPYGFKALLPDLYYRMYGKIQGNGLKREILAPQVIRDTAPELVFPNYPLTTGITSSFLANLAKQSIEILEKNPIEWMSEELRKAHGLCGLTGALKEIHFPRMLETAQAARRRLAFDELLQLQLGMMMRKQKGNHSTALPLEQGAEEYIQNLPFTLTEGQLKAIQEILTDMKQTVPMNRLLQGDVGSGKTAVAAAACFIAAKSGVQCAFMAPTEILAQQHVQTLKKFLEPLGVSVTLLTGSMKAKEKRAVLMEIETGVAQVIVGTHAIFQKDVTFKKLALVIMDEQHRFGVEQRKLLADKGGTPHKLVMSATPIPRTLALMIYGDLDISVLKDKPMGRLPIETYAVTGKLRQRAFKFVEGQLQAGHQAYIVCPMIDENDTLELQSVKSYAEEIQKGAFQNWKVGLLHGKMKASEKDEVMEAFYEGKLDLLVSTTVIEVGVDVPNATILVVENAERFGLSQLHQLRGRVGRSDVQSYCILITDHVTPECKARMQIMSRTADGFEIAEEDLRLRGPGDFFGQKQSGLPPLHVADMTQDTLLIAEVQETAKKILEEDPELKHKDNAGLRLEVMRLFAKSGENGRN